MTSGSSVDAQKRWRVRVEVMGLGSREEGGKDGSLPGKGARLCSLT